MLTCTDLDAIILSESLSFTVGVPLLYLVRSAFGSTTRVFSSSYIQNSSLSCTQHSCFQSLTFTAGVSGRLSTSLSNAT